MHRIGRFIVKDLLGSGTQGKVYRCEDPRLQRQVAIKLLHRPLLSQGDAGHALLREARAMGRLSHQNLVAVYDVGDLKKRPYLVFELIEGRPLSRLLREDPPDVPAALSILDGILAGIAQAHEHGIVHRDIKPANIIVTRTGVPKVTDFGIAAALRDDAGHQTQVVGTPRYMAPEYIREGRVMKQTDVFALGLVAYEMLAGRPAYAGGDPHRLMYDIVHRPVQPLDQLVPDMDPRLQSIIERALEKDPQLRYPDAGAMRDALRAYHDLARPRAAPEHAHSTIQFLLRRMRLKSDFPALAQSISTLNELAASDRRDTTQLANIIVKDQGLSSKILRVVNSAYYAAFSGSIGTISRAIVILGVNGVRSIAASLSLLEHFGEGDRVGHLKDMLSESLYAGLCARELCKSVARELAEEALLGTMLRRLGGILVAYYLPEEEQEIQRLSRGEGLDPVQAQTQVLGTTYAEIGRAVAGEWNFPRDIRQCLEDPEKPPRGRAADPRQQLQLMAVFADRATTVLRSGRSQQSMQAMKSLVTRYARALGVAPESMVESIGCARREYLDFRLGCIDAGERARFVATLDGGGADPAPVEPRAGAEQDPLTLTVSEEGVINAQVNGLLAPEQVLTEGLQEVTQLLVSEHRPEQLVQLVLEILYRGMGFRRVVLGRWRADRKEVQGSAGLGDRAERLVERFRVRCVGRPDILSLALIQNTDVYIKDATQSSVQTRMPAWFKGTRMPGSFFVLPMRGDSGPLGMLYAEYGLAYGFDENPNVLHLVQALRNQLLLGLARAAAAPAGLCAADSV